MTMCNVERVDCSDKPTENYPPTLQFSPAPHHSCQPCFQLQRADNFMAKVLKKEAKRQKIPLKPELKEELILDYYSMNANIALSF